MAPPFLKLTTVIFFYLWNSSIRRAVIIYEDIVYSIFINLPYDDNIVIFIMLTFDILLAYIPRYLPSNAHYSVLVAVA